jgi:hypothetical protein
LTEIIVTEELVIISAVHCNTTCCSFYDAAGDLLPNALEVILKLEAAHQCPVLGWFVTRRGPVVQPSMRDLAVLNQMPSLSTSNRKADAGQAQAPLFAAIGLSDAAGGAIDSYQYKFYRSGGSAGPGRVVPIDVEITNIGARQQHPSFPASLRPSMLGGPATANELKTQKAFASMAKATSAQTEGVEQMFDCLVEQLHTVARDVAAGLQEVEQQRETNLALRRDIDRNAASNSRTLSAAELTRETSALDLNR